MRALSTLTLPSAAVSSARPSTTLPIASLAPLKARPGARVVAVLPIVNLGSPDDTYLIDGILEDLVDNLSVVRGLLIRPRGETLESLRDADGNSLVDLVWLDRCPLFDVLRTDAEFIKLRERVAVRAARVISALDVHSPTMV